MHSSPSLGGWSWSTYNGAVFTVTTKEASITIRAVTATFCDYDADATVYVTKGTTVNVQVKEQWFDAGTTRVQGSRKGTFGATLPLKTPLFVPAGQTRGIYIHSTQRNFVHMTNCASAANDQALRLEGYGYTSNSIAFPNFNMNTNVAPLSAQVIYER